MRAGRETQTPADRLALALMSLALLLPVSFASRRLCRQLLPAPSPLFQAFGMAIFLFGFVIIVMSMLQNEYAVTDRTFRKWPVINWPMAVFTAMRVTQCIWVFCCSPPAPHCGWAALRRRCLQQSLIANNDFSHRCEEATLCKDLPGYVAYTEK